MRYNVQLRMIQYHDENVEVEAESAEQASKLAMEGIDDVEFNDLTDTEYEVLSVEGKQKEWSGSCDPRDPANYWIDDETNERVSAATGERTVLSQTEREEIDRLTAKQ